MPFYILCLIITVSLIITTIWFIANDYLNIGFITILLAIVFFTVTLFNLPLKLESDDKYFYNYYELLISENKVTSKTDLNEINNINERIKNGKKAQNNYFLKNFNCNHEWAKLDELDEDKAYKSYMEYIDKNND